MVDFAKSFEKGMEAAENLERQKKEIADVFADLNQQLDPVTNGLIHVLIASMPEERPSSIAGGLVMATEIFARGSRQTYLAIVGCNVHYREELKTLAKWGTNNGGYPCVLEYGNIKQSCDDKKSLEMAISSLIEHPLTGRVFYMLMHRIKDNTNTEK